MKISAKTDYACIAVLELSKQYELDTPISISTISDRHGISETFLVHIMKDLKKEGIVESTRGAKGGYHLSRPPVDISVAEVIQAIEGPFIDVKCMNSSGGEGCELESNCDLPSVWDLVKLRIVSVLEEMSFRDVKRLSNAFQEDRKTTFDASAAVEQAFVNDG